jgi:hypothetical protein
MFMASVMPFAALMAQEAQVQSLPLPQIQQQGNISFISGGVGLEESTALQAVEKDYNLRMTSADSVGHYYGETHVTVSDMQHNTLLDTTGGPLIYAQLPKGKYLVAGTTDDGQRKQQKITITGKKPVRVHFSWKTSADVTNQIKE